MDVFQNMLSLQMQMFAMGLLGVFLKRIGLITVPGRKMLSSLLLNVFVPCSIFYSFQSSGPPSGETARIYVLTLLISTAIQAVALGIGPPLFGRYPAEKNACCTIA